ncbi:MAG: DUF929 family protein [Gaiellales bacterium]
MTKDKQAQRDRREARAREAMTSRPKSGGISGMWIAVGAVVAIAAVIVVMVIVSQLNNGSSSSSSNSGNTPSGNGTVPASVMHDVESVPASTFNTIGVGSQKGFPVALNGHTPKQDGKPVVVYIGAEYCPYCAAERWPVVTALSRFGKFSNLGQTHSSSTDAFPNTPTFSFHGSSYSSPYITFDPVETATNQPQGSGYAPLDTPSQLQAQIFNTYNRPPYFSQTGAIPFVSYANKYGLQGASYLPSVIDGMTMEQIAGSLNDTTSPVAQAIVGTSNSVSAAVCAIDGGRPASVCNSPGVKAAAQKFIGG